MKGYLLVQADGNRYGVRVADVRQVTEVEELTPTPKVHPAVLGVAHIDGRLTPVVHLGGLLARSDEMARRGSTVVVAECGGSAVAFAVDDAEAVVPEEPQPLPSGWRLPWASGVARVADELIPIIDMDVLAELLLPAGVHQRK